MEGAWGEGQERREVPERLTGRQARLGGVGSGGGRCMAGSQVKTQKAGRK